MNAAPNWHRSVRYIGRDPWVPFQIADELQTALDQVTTRASSLERALEEQTAQAREAEEAPDWEDRARRLAADLANLRRHTDEQVRRARMDERVARLRDLATTHDAITRALNLSDNTDDAWVIGNRSVLAQVREAMARAGATETATVGAPFDPQVHEAVARVPTDQVPPGTIAHIEQQGFRLADQTLVRPARVVVAASPEEEQ